MTKSLREIGYNDEGKINGRQAERIKRAMRRNTNKSFRISTYKLKRNLAKWDRFTGEVVSKGQTDV